MIAAATPLSTHIAVWLAGLFGLDAPAWPFHVVAMLVVAVIIVLLVALVALVGIYLERKIAGRMQNRRGPNRVGPHGILQTLADAVKLLSKEDIVRAGADVALFRFAPYVVFASAFAGYIVLPFAPNIVPADLDVGIFFFLAMIGLETIGIVMAGWSSNNKWSLIGSMREVAQVVSYELPLGIAAMCPVLVAGTLSVRGIADFQQGWFWNWMIIRHGYWAIVMVPCFLTFYIAGLAAAKRAPFDLPEAESELVAGFHTEYSGIRFGMFFLP
ncbi:MAG: complex I subunit 1/NuoH family protein, partial [Planctomycetota bacterium]